MPGFWRETNLRTRGGATMSVRGMPDFAIAVLEDEVAVSDRGLRSCNGCVPSRVVDSVPRGMQAAPAQRALHEVGSSVARRLHAHGVLPRNTLHTLRTRTGLGV